ncbi:deoxyribonuclease IV [Candidatus Sumerlaeota bacterium]|nr:deoxyribonuclease IV [Candidatus Sumerlaeota bacterium]
MGAHMSVSGGVDQAIDRARSAGCTALQIFLKNNNQWSGKPFEEEVIARWRAEVAKGDLGLPIAHNSYLVNLASPRPELLDKSVANMLDDLRRAETLGVPGIVTHPGAHMGEGETNAIKKIGGQINLLFDQTPGNPAALYLETTAGQGSSVGHRFEHLRDIIALVKEKNRVGVCVDTCHIFAAGYDIRTPEGYAATFEEFDRVIGLDMIRAFHVNDSKKDFGTRVDRHAHIGQGFIGEKGFACLMRDPRFVSIPHILETPKDEKTLEEDRMNLATLRRLAG